MLFKEIFKIYIQGNIHVAFAGAAWMLLTQIYAGIEYNCSILIFGFCMTFLSYNFIKYRHMWRHFANRKWWPFFLLGSLVTVSLALFQFLFFSRASQFLLLVITFLTLLYTVPISGSNLRNKPHIKIYIIACTWASFSTLFPLIESTTPFGFGAWLFFIQRFLLVFVVLLIFDINDLQLDPLSLCTIPQRIGLVRTKILGFFLLLACLLMDYFYLSAFETVSKTITALFVFLIMIFLLFAKPGKFALYSNFYLEAVPILWCFSALVFDK